MIQIESVRYYDEDEALNGLMARDDATTRRPGILVMHGGAGLDQHAKGRARRFAEAGYVAFACDMYGDRISGKRDLIMEHIGDLRRNRSALRRRAQAAIDTLIAHPRVDGRIAVVGYCLGGMIALELARDGVAIAGAVSVHGGLQTARPAEAGVIKAKILVCHGSLDPHGPISHVAAFAEEMDRAGADCQIVLYGGALHGFTHEAAVQPANGVGYNAAADARSSRAIHAFLDEVFTD